MRVKGVLILAVLGLLGGLLVTVLPSTPAEASHVFYDQADAQGSNDVPGQKDLTQLAFDFSHASQNEFHFRWQWDDVGSSGANTLDACGLIDTDGNGLAEYAQCASTTGDPAVLSTTTVWACGNNYADRCVGYAPPTVAPAYACSVAQVAGSNPFTGDTDTRATCQIQLDPFPPLTALINVCSYPSHPGSAPADCVLAPGSGVVIIKDAGSDTTTPFSFLLEQNNGTDIGTFTVVGSGQSVFIPLANNNQTYRLTETVPTGWTQTAASCNNAAASAPSSFTMTTADATVRCSFTNARILYSDLSITKSDDLDPAVPGATVTYTLGVTNAGPDAAAGVQLSDTLPAGLTALSATATGGGICSIAANPVTCSLGSIPSGGSRTVTIAARVSAAITGLPRTLTDTATVSTTSTDSVSANNTDREDTAVVAPITVTKAADVASVPETGGPVTFTFATTNNGPLPVTLTALNDSVFGDLDDRGTCAVPRTVAAGATYTCALTETIAGAPAASHVDDVTATVTDGYGQVRTRTSPPVTVTFDDEAPVATVVKSADVTSVPETGGAVAFTVAVTNDALEGLTLDTLVDSEFGDLDGRGDCAVPQTIAVGGTYECTFTETLAGNAGGAHRDTVTASLGDDDGNNLNVDSNEVVIDFTGVDPELLVGKSADVASVPEDGGAVTFTVTLANPGDEAVVVTALTDSVFGDLDGRGDCAVPVILAPTATATCSFTESLAGAPGLEHRDTVSARAEDDDGVAVLADSEEVVVTFADVASSLAVTKTPSPTSVPESGGDVLFGISVENTSAIDVVTIGSVADDVLGDLSADCAVALPTDLAPGETLSCSHLASLAGDAGVDHGNTVTVRGTDDDGGLVEATAMATVAFTDVAPVASVTKSVTPGSVPESGGEVEFTVTVHNDGAEDLTLDALVDSDFGDLDGRGDCALPATIAVAGDHTCSFTARVEGQAGTSHLDTITATVVDDEATEVEVESDEAEVLFTDVASSLSVVKSAAVGQVPPSGDDVAFSAEVTNTSAVDRVTVDEVVDDVFGDVSAGCAPALPADLAPGASLSCDFTGFVDGPLGSTHTNVVTASGTDDDGAAVQADDDLDVLIADGPSTVSVVKEADVASVPETGGSVTFTVGVENTSVLDDVTVTSMVDSVFGDVSSSCAPALPAALAPGDTVTCSFREWLAGNADGAHRDTVTVYGLGDDGDPVEEPSNEVEVAFDDVAPVASVVKSADVASVPETGGAVAFTAVVGNDGDEPFVLNALVDSDFGGLDGRGDCAVPQTIPAGSVYECSFTETIAGNAGGVHRDTVTATVADDDGNEPSVESNEVEVAFTDVVPRVLVGKSASVTSVLEPGGPVTFGVTLANPGDEAITVTALSDSVFGDLDGRGDCVVPLTLAPSATATCAFTATVSGSAGAVHRDTVTATVTDDDDNTVDGVSDEVEVGVDDVASTLAVTKTPDVDEVPETGAPVTYTVVVENDSLADTVTVEDVVDDVFGDVSGSCASALPVDLAPGADLECSFTRTLQGDAGAAHVNRVTATGTDDDGAPVTAHDDATVRFTDVVPVIEVTKTPSVSTVVEPGGPVTFTVAVHNPSPVDEVTVDGVVDDVFGDVSAACGVPLVVGPGGTVGCDFTGDVVGDAGDQHENTVTVSGADDDGSPVGGTASAQVPILDDEASAISVTKTPSVDEVDAPGEDVTFAVEVHNDSPHDTVTIEDLTDEFGASVLDLGIDCGLPADLEPGETLDCSFGRAITGTGGEQDVDVVTAGGQDDDGNAIGASASATVTVRPVVALEVTKDDGGSRIVPGRDFAYELRVTNSGPSTAQDPTTLVDDLPDGLSLVSAAGSGWDCSSSTTDHVECVQPGPVASGAAYPPVQVIVATDPDLTGRVRNTAAATNPDDPDGDGDTIETRTVPIADLDLMKTARQATAALGEVIDYDIRLHNDGPSTATGIVVTEAPAAGLEFVSATADTGRFSAATGTWHVDRLEVGGTTVLHYRARLVGRTGTANEAWVSEAGQVDPDSRPGELASHGTEDDEAEATIRVADAQTPPDPDDPPADPADDADGETLPRTGAEILRLVLLGLGLVAGGVTIIRRRRTA